MNYKCEIIRCPRCGGCGEVTLSKHLQATLDFIRENGNCTSEQIWQGLGKPCRQTGINNRLCELENLQLIVRVKKHIRSVVWRAI